MQSFPIVCVRIVPVWIANRKRWGIEEEGGFLDRWSSVKNRSARRRARLAADSARVFYGLGGKRRYKKAKKT